MRGACGNHGWHSADIAGHSANGGSNPAFAAIGGFVRTETAINMMVKSTQFCPVSGGNQLVAQADINSTQRRQKSLRFSNSDRG